MNTRTRFAILVGVLLLAVCSAQAAEEGCARHLRSKVPAVREQAAVALGRIGDKSAVPPLVEALKDPEKGVRREAARALGFIKDARAVTPLIAALGDSDRNVRLYAAYALGEIKDLRAVEALLDALRDPEWCVRDQAAWALRETADPTIAGRLVATLKDSSADLAQVTWLLGRLDATATVGHLAAHWSFDDRNTQIAKDVTDRGNDGRVLGSTPVEGKVGAALRFEHGHYIELGQPAGLPIAEQPLTLMAWVKSDAPSGVVVARGGAFCGFSLYIKDGLAKFGIRRAEEEPAYIAAGEENVVGRWAHLAGVVKNDRIEVYVDGKLAGTAKTPGYIPGNCGQGMEIGFDVANSPAEITDNFEGILDEVKVYHAALTEKEIAEQGTKNP
ncbi:MAG: HEAT repeat domain-containing protein [Planctomycetota bacterium]